MLTQKGWFSVVTVALCVSIVPLIPTVLVNRTPTHRNQVHSWYSTWRESISLFSFGSSFSFPSCGVSRLKSVAPSTSSSTSVGDPDEFTGQLGWVIPPAGFGFCHRVQSLVTPSHKHLRREEPRSGEHLSCERNSCTPSFSHKSQTNLAVKCSFSSSLLRFIRNVYNSSQSGINLLGLRLSILGLNTVGSSCVNCIRPLEQCGW